MIKASIIYVTGSQHRVEPNRTERALMLALLAGGVVSVQALPMDGLSLTRAVNRLVFHRLIDRVWSPRPGVDLALCLTPVGYELAYRLSHGGE